MTDRGPVVYCLEEKDNGIELHKLRLNPDASFSETFRSDLLEGVMTLETQGERLENSWTNDVLYCAASEEHYEKRMLHFIPYYA